jgi:hypothetical protein
VSKILHYQHYYAENLRILPTLSTLPTNIGSVGKELTHILYIGVWVQLPLLGQGLIWWAFYKYIYKCYLSLEVYLDHDESEEPNSSKPLTTKINVI